MVACLATVVCLVVITCLVLSSFFNYTLAVACLVGKGNFSYGSLSSNGSLSSCGSLSSSVVFFQLNASGSLSGRRGQLQ